MRCSTTCLSNWFRIISFTVGCVNMLCSIFWVVFIAFDGGADSSSPPSMARVAMIMTAIGIVLGMDFSMSLAAMSPRSEQCLGAVIIILCPWTMPCFLGRDWRCNMWAGYAPPVLSNDIFGDNVHFIG